MDLPIQDFKVTRRPMLNEYLLMMKMMKILLVILNVLFLYEDKKVWEQLLRDWNPKCAWLE
jgi:hypothetical protein